MKVNCSVTSARSSIQNWTSSDSSVDTIGQVKGLAVGETSVKVSLNDGVSKTIAIKVYEILLESIETEVNIY